MPLPPPIRPAAALACAAFALAAVACAPVTPASPAPAPATASMSTPSPPSRMPADDGGHARCDAAPAARFVGQALEATIEADAKAASGARTVRVIRPGMAVTMDYREDRLNIEVDDAGRIRRVHCG